MSFLREIPSRRSLREGTTPCKVNRRFSGIHNCPPEIPTYGVDVHGKQFYVTHPSTSLLIPRLDTFYPPSTSDTIIKV